MQLKKLFDYQASLMEKLAPVETELGYSPPRIPLDFTQRASQDWFRLMSWYYTEELVEAMTAAPGELAEELADCLHFGIELCILAGVSYMQVEAMLQADLFEDPCPPFQDALRKSLIDLGLACNQLKAKHWKRNPQPADMEAVKYFVASSLHFLIQHIRSLGLDPEVIYMAKHSKNEQRIKDKY